ncbi:MAG: TolC family protein, partial [Novosphingobium sp.]|nr:TolC family protein [Novosphingobium sp.]
AALQRSALRRLAVLSARDPVAFVAEGAKLAAEASTPDALAAHDPRTLLRMRPDVQIAEARLAAAFERAGASRAALYPSLSLGATGGFAATPADFGSPGAFRFAVGPALNWGIFNLGRVKAGIAAADATSESAAAQWQQTLLAAVEEADGAIDNWLTARKAAATARRALTAATVFRDTVRSRHTGGLASAFKRARAEADYLAAQADCASVEAEERSAWAVANLALGAGWRLDGPPG